jgi:hypothetical protein
MSHPVREIDCITCADKAASVSPVFADGTGKCKVLKEGQRDLPATIAVANQRWKVVYVDAADKVETEGLNNEFGLYVNRPFYIRSRLPMKRIAECQGASNVFLKRWRKNVAAQQWVFDPVRKVIRSNYWKNYIMQIPGNGAQNELRMTATINSRWW